ncbi:GNAT family N-acetyltransferase [Alteromonas sp. H39]|uniref:GNAT family N-acetyltransferase n=1 Tax=Alteromonas sp. H39 TaxID=3389876 RepID=UPI0039E05B9C
MNLNIRPATAADMASAVPLLLDSGEQLLIDIFGNGERDSAYQYLCYAWSNGYGQYGFQNHWVACIDDKVVGLMTCWHDKLPADFDRDTLSSITEHFGLDKSIDVVMRSQRFSAALHPPLVTELGIGHLSVASDARRQGVGRALLGVAEEKARELKKFAMVLDVEVSNETARQFYQALGFGEHQHAAPFLQMIRAVRPS